MDDCAAKKLLFIPKRVLGQLKIDQKSCCQNSDNYTDNKYHS